MPFVTIGRSAAVRTATTPGLASAADGVDRDDPGVGRQGQDGSRVEQATDLDIGRELGATGHLGTTIDAGDGTADRAGQNVHVTSIHLRWAVRTRGSIHGYRNSTTASVKARPTMSTNVTLRIITRSSRTMARYRMYPRPG